MTLDIEAIEASATNATYLGGEAQEQADNVLALITKVERLQAQIEAVKALHKPSLFGDCAVCFNEPFPCKTIRLLGVEE